MLSFKAGAVRLFDAVSQSMGLNLVAANDSALSKISLGTLVELIQDGNWISGRVVEVRLVFFCCGFCDFWR